MKKFKEILIAIGAFFVGILTMLAYMFIKSKVNVITKERMEISSNLWKDRELYKEEVKAANKALIKMHKHEAVTNFKNKMRGCNK